MPARRLQPGVPDAELAQRRSQWLRPAAPAARGWVKLYTEHVLQADTGADPDFLASASGHEVPRDSH